MGDDCEDDYVLPQGNIFGSIVDDIMKNKQRLQEEMFRQMEEEEESNAQETEETQLMGKIKEKLKASQAAKKGGKRGRKKKACEDDEKAEIETVPEVLPPPTRRSKRNAKSKVMEEISVVERPPSPDNLTPVAKRRLKKLQTKTDMQKKKMDEEIKQVLKVCNSAKRVKNFHVEEESWAESIYIQISYMCETYKLKVEKEESFDSIYSKVAELLKLKASEILLCYGDVNITLSDTPSKLNIMSFDIIDCVPYKESSSSEQTSSFQLKFQSNDNKERVDIKAHVLEKFKDIMQRYADLRDIPLKQLVFKFDGEVIEPSATPHELDMESDSCIDVKVLGWKPPKPSTPDIEVLKDCKPIKMMNICVLD